MAATSGSATSKKAYAEVKVAKRNSAIQAYELLVTHERTSSKGASARKLIELGKETNLMRVTSHVMGARLTDLSKCGLIVVRRIVKDPSTKKSVQAWRTSTVEERKTLRRLGAIDVECAATNPKMTKVLRPFFTTVKGRRAMAEMTKRFPYMKPIADALMQEVVFQHTKSIGIGKVMEYGGTRTEFQQEAWRTYAAKFEKGHRPLQREAFNTCVQIKAASAR